MRMGRREYWYILLVFVSHNLISSYFLDQVAHYKENDIDLGHLE